MHDMRQDMMRGDRGVTHQSVQDVQLPLHMPCFLFLFFFDRKKREHWIMSSRKSRFCLILLSPFSPSPRHPYPSSSSFLPLHLCTIACLKSSGLNRQVWAVLCEVKERRQTEEWVGSRRKMEKVLNALLSQLQRWNWWETVWGVCDSRGSFAHWSVMQLSRGLLV